MPIYRKMDPSEVDDTLLALVELTVTAAAWHLGVPVPEVVWMQETTGRCGLNLVDFIETPDETWGAVFLGNHLWLNVDMPQDQCIAVALHEMRHVQHFAAGLLSPWKPLNTAERSVAAEVDADSYALWITGRRT